MPPRQDEALMAHNKASGLNGKKQMTFLYPAF
jgi:hypothetical protein